MKDLRFNAARHSLALAAALACQPLWAQSSESDQRVEITSQKEAPAFGAKTGIPLDRMPQSLQVIDAEQLLRDGVQSMGDVLRDVPSANAGSSRVSRYQSFTLKVRGFIADQARNGLRQRYYEDIDASALSNVERVEVLKGPSSVLFGHSAMGGVISLVTKTPPAAFGGQAAVTMGSDERRQATIDIGGPLDDGGRLRARAVAEIERSGTFVDHQDMRRNNAALDLDWSISPDMHATLVAEYIARHTLSHPGLPVDGTLSLGLTPELSRSLYLGEPTQSPLNADAPLLQLGLDIALPGGWTLTPRYQYQEFNSDFTQIRVREMGADGHTLARNGRIGREDDDYQIAQLDLKGRVEAGGLAHHLLAGVEWNREHSTFHQDNLTNVGAIDVRDPVYTFVGGTRPESTFAFDLVGDVKGWSVYLQDRLSITPHWEVIAGARWSDFRVHSVFNDAVDDSSIQATSWQLGSHWQLGGGWTAFGGWNTGIDLENVAGSRNQAGEPFRPERSAQIEAGIRRDGVGWRGSLSVFQIRRYDALTTDPTNPDFMVQTGEQRVRGIELEGQWQPAAGWRLSGGYAWTKGEVTRSEDGDQGTELGDTPRHHASLNAAWALPGTAWELRAGAEFVGSRLLVNGSDVRLPAYRLLDLGAHWQTGPWRVDATVSNALDARYFTASGNAFSVNPGDPRQFTLRLAYAL